MGARPQARRRDSTVAIHFSSEVRYGRHIEFEYEVNTASSEDAQTLSNSLAQFWGGRREKRIATFGCS